MKNKILIVAGDPNSINSEIIFKSWKRSNKRIKSRIIIIGNYNLLKEQSKQIKINIKLKKINSIEEDLSNNILNVINFPLKFKNCFKVHSKNSSKYISDCLNFVHKLAINKRVSGFINCPIDKRLITNKGTSGVTELLAKKSKIKKNSEVMFLYNKKLAVVPITTHIRIKDVSKKLNKNIIIKKINTIKFYYKKLFNQKLRLAILGLNPHNSEFSKNSEEKKIIIPSIKYLAKNTEIKGPFSCDSFFIDQFKNYNVVVGMYHDQVLTPFKRMFKFDAINITLGLKYVRVSPDHGTATELIGENKANFISLFQCIKFINNLK